MTGLLALMLAAGAFAAEPRAKPAEDAPQALTTALDSIWAELGALDKTLPPEYKEASPEDAVRKTWVANFHARDAELDELIRKVVRFVAENKAGKAPRSQATCTTYGYGLREYGDARRESWILERLIVRARVQQAGCAARLLTRKLDGDSKSARDVLGVLAALRVERDARQDRVRALTGGR